MMMIEMMLREIMGIIIILTMAKEPTLITDSLTVRIMVMTMFMAMMMMISKLMRVDEEDDDNDDIQDDEDDCMIIKMRKLPTLL